jgi:hypothetical protein
MTGEEMGDIQVSNPHTFVNVKQSVYRPGVAQRVPGI